LITLLSKVTTSQNSHGLSIPHGTRDAPKVILGTRIKITKAKKDSPLGIRPPPILVKIFLKNIYINNQYSKYYLFRKWVDCD
jgi:hypothetical protein